MVMGHGNDDPGGDGDDSYDMNFRTLCTLSHCLHMHTYISYRYVRYMICITYHTYNYPYQYISTFEPVQEEKFLYEKKSGRIDKLF